MIRGDETERRAFWTLRNDEAWQFMFEKILPYPVEECGELLVSLPEAAAAAGVRVAFANRPHVDGLERLFFLRQGQIPAFLAAAAAFNARGWAIRVEDGFRTREIQKRLGRTPMIFDVILARVIWELGGTIPTADFMFRRCSGLVATIPKFATHMSGSAIDVSVVHLDDAEREVDRGAPYVELSELTPMDSRFISEAAQRHRHEITRLMDDHGFVAYPFEFWHYSSGDAYDQVLRRTGRPAIYGPVDLDRTTLQVTPIDTAADRRLNSEAEIRVELEQAIARLRST